MVVCVCNNLNTKAILEAIAGGCNKPDQIHIYHGGTPQCCSCFDYIEEMVNDQKDN